MIRLIAEAISQGRKVATNFDLWMEHLCKGGGPTHVIRLPDHPSVSDFRSLGFGLPDSTEWKGQRKVVNEGMNGIIVLDEVSAILDNRAWSGKARSELVQWLVHTRKIGWDLYLIAQSAKMIDSLVREALLEQRVICVRLDKVPIPLFGWVFKVFGLAGRFGRCHLATVNFKGMVVARWWVWPWQMTRFYKAYDTLQLFQGHGDPGYLPITPVVRREKEPDLIVLPQGSRQYLDLYRAPYLRDPRRGVREWLANWLDAKSYPRLATIVRPRRDPGPWVDVHLVPLRGVGFSYKPAPVSYRDWLSARAAPAGRLGGEAGEAAAPATEELAHAAE